MGSERKVKTQACGVSGPMTGAQAKSKAWLREFKKMSGPAITVLTIGTVLE